MNVPLTIGEISGKYNYQAFDCIRPLIATNQNIAFWYRFNTILYVHKDSQTTLSKLIMIQN